ncbi:MAG: hypothetical protein ACW972_08130 [Promethearchaeota archaeon]|jgi:hypothetical protein
MVSIKKAVNNLQKHYPDASKVVVVDKQGKTLFSSGKWEVKKDIKEVIANWAEGNAQFVTLNGIKFSILQMEPERFVATNRKNKGHLIGATTPDGTMSFIAYIKPKAKGWFHMAYPAVARAAAMIKKGVESKFIETEIDLSDVNESNIVESSNTYASSALIQKPLIDPSLKAEIDGFLQWVNNPQGLSGYVSYVIQQNDTYRISQLAEIYNEFYQIFYGK